MANPPTPAKNNDVNGTLVTGDFIIDQHIYEGERHQYADHTPGVRVKAEVERAKAEDASDFRCSLQLCSRRGKPDGKPMMAVGIRHRIAVFRH